MSFCVIPRWTTATHRVAGEAFPPNPTVGGFLLLSLPPFNHSSNKRLDYKLYPRVRLICSRIQSVHVYLRIYADAYNISSNGRI